MAKMQLRLYVETTDEDSTRERQLLMYIRDQFNDDYNGFDEDVKADGNEVLTHQSRIERGW